MADPTDPRLTPLALSLPATVPFVGPEAQERARGKPFVARLGANESAFGPSPKAIAAMHAAAAGSWQYADPEAHDLRQAIAAHHGIDAAHIMVGEGIDTLLGNLVRLTVAPGDPVVTSAGAYPTFNYHVTGFGGILHTVPYAGDFEDPERLTARAAEVGAKLIYIANPDNPMGSHHGAATIQRMVSHVPDSCLLVLDEAYIDLAPEGTVPFIAPDDDRVIRMRTFSKAYGLAGARVGYAIGPRPLIAAFDRVRNHFGMARISQAAALAALRDQDWLGQVKAMVVAARDRLAGVARDNGLTPLPSATNFVTMDCGQDGAFARQVVKALGEAGIFVRMPFVAPHDRCIRVSCGPDDAIAAFAAALPQALSTARAAS
ncbi:histidinol-phosphate aminotransferase [Loktanella atrilutea]|uniref:histidinol-phosphate transaminase n=1 Tax=Loktanella atrilutea TaxID=366533 RepID=A0A1M4ST68_LOKAT|nr:pyridoxal phosphate-dependent aminotransferase [Loktanella atrilutea]SHE35386.1 histidinol-phosphate aminotransferase [Loktanella atrilutea]